MEFGASGEEVKSLLVELCSAYNLSVVGFPSWRHEHIRPDLYKRTYFDSAEAIDLWSVSGLHLFTEEGRDDHIKYKELDLSKPRWIKLAQHGSRFISEPIATTVTVQAFTDLRVEYVDEAAKLRHKRLVQNIFPWLRRRAPLRMWCVFDDGRPPSNRYVWGRALWATERFAELAEIHNDTEPVFQINGGHISAYPPTS